MMNAAASRPTEPSDRSRWVRLALMAGAGALLGASLAYFGGRSLPDLPWADLMAGATAAGLLISGGLSILLSANRRALSAMASLEGEAGDCEIRAARRQGLVVVLAGVLLLLPVVSARSGFAPEMSLAAVLAIFAAQTWINVSVWRRGDEMTRRTVLESGAVTFWILQGALFLYAAAERLGLAPAATAWQLMVVMMSAYLVLSSVVALRRGYA